MDFHTFGDEQSNKKTENWDEICQMLVSGALDDTKTIGKVGADIFAKSGPEKKPSKSETIKIFYGFFLIFVWI